MNGIDLHISSGIIRGFLALVVLIVIIGTWAVGVKKAKRYESFFNTGMFIVLAFLSWFGLFKLLEKL